MALFRCGAGKGLYPITATSIYSGNGTTGTVTDLIVGKTYIVGACGDSGIGGISSFSGIDIEETLFSDGEGKIVIGKANATSITATTGGGTKKNVFAIQMD